MSEEEIVEPNGEDTGNGEEGGTELDTPEETFWIPPIAGTDYDVDISRDDSGDFQVTITKPAHPEDIYNLDGYEVVGSFYHYSDTPRSRLLERIETIIREDKQLHVRAGMYKGSLGGHREEPYGTGD